MQRRILRTEGESAADGERGGDEFPDDRSEGDIAVVDVKRCLGLVDAAAPRAGENQLDQGSHQKAHAHGHKKQPELPRVRRRPERKHLDPADGDAETDHQEAGDDPDKNRKNQKEPLVPIRRQTVNIRRVRPITPLRRNRNRVDS